jgi:hypothetical protein
MSSPTVMTVSFTRVLCSMEIADYTKMEKVQTRIFQTEEPMLNEGSCYEHV